MTGASSSWQCLCLHARQCATYIVTNTLRCTTTTLKRKVEVVKTDPVPDGQHVHLDKEEASSQVLTSTISNEQLALPQGEWILEKDGGSMCLVQNPKNSDEHAGVLVSFRCDFLQQKLACTAAAEHMITQDNVVDSLDCANGVVSEASLPRPS